MLSLLIEAVSLCIREKKMSLYGNEIDVISSILIYIDKRFYGYSYFVCSHFGTRYLSKIVFLFLSPSSMLLLFRT